MHGSNELNMYVRTVSIICYFFDSISIRSVCIMDVGDLIYFAGTITKKHNSKIFIELCVRCFVAMPFSINVDNCKQYDEYVHSNISI